MAFPQSPLWVERASSIRRRQWLRPVFTRRLGKFIVCLQRRGSGIFVVGHELELSARSGRDEANGRATALIAFGTGPNIHPW
jgi:hypothetical protein